MVVFKKGQWNQYLAGSVAGLSYGYCGMSYVWVTPVLLRQLTPKSDLRIVSGQADLAVVLPELTSLVSPFFVSHAADRWGRRTALLWTAPLQAITCLALSLVSGPEVAILFIRGLQGVIMGAVQTVLPLYLAEIADAESRGKLSVLYTLGWNIGLLAEYTLSPLISDFQINYINMIPPLIFFVAFMYFEESPYYLILVNDLAGAKRALESFRDVNTNCIDELLEIENTIAEERKDESSWRDLLDKKKGRKGLIIVLVVSITFNLCGAMSVVVYLNRTFDIILGKKVFTDSVAAGIAAGLTLVTVICLATVDRIGRRPVILFSYIGSAICLLPPAIFFVEQEVYGERMQLAVVSSIVGLVLFPSFITLGALTIVHTYQGELFTTSTRGVASALVTLVGSLSSTAALASFPLAQNGHKDYVTFALYIVAALIGLTFSILVVPETKGKTMEQIQKDFEE